MIDIPASRFDGVKGFTHGAQIPALGEGAAIRLIWIHGIGIYMFFGAYFGMNASAAMTVEDLGISDKIKGLSIKTSLQESPYFLNKQPSADDVNSPSGIYLFGSPSNSYLLYFCNASKSGFIDLDQMFTAFVPESILRFK